jgi:hypothetical protein
MQNEKVRSPERCAPFLDLQAPGANSILTFHPALAAIGKVGGVVFATGDTLPGKGWFIGRFKADADADDADDRYDQHGQRKGTHSQSLLIKKTLHGVNYVLDSFCKLIRMNAK